MSKAKGSKGKAKTVEPADKRGQSTDGTQQAHIVSGEGTDAEIRARCVEGIPGFEEMTEKVQGELVRLMRVFWEMPPSPAYELRDREDGGKSIAGPAGSNITLTALRTVEAFASNSPHLTDRRLTELAGTAKARGEMNTDNLMADLAFVVGGGAKDTVQSALLTQMAATHAAALKALNLSVGSQWAEQSVQMGNLANRLLSTFARQAETLAKLQRDGTQTVKHVHIDNRHGGQAVVTDTIHTGGVNAKQADQAHATAAIGASAALPGQDAQGYGMPVTGSERQGAVPYAWLCEGVGSETGESE